MKLLLKYIFTIPFVLWLTIAIVITTAGFSLMQNRMHAWLTLAFFSIVLIIWMIINFKKFKRAGKW